jgi:hypothetical protein
MPQPKLAWRQGGIPYKRVIPAGNFRPAKASTKVFDAAFYKKPRFAPLSKSGSQRQAKVGKVVVEVKKPITDRSA